MGKKDPEQASKHAVALRYENGDCAPRVIASGVGELAQRIIDLAKQNNIPIRKDDLLVDILGKLNLGYEIPPETYQAVADIMAFLYWTDEEWRAEKEGENSPILARVPKSKKLTAPAVAAAAEPAEKKTAQKKASTARAADSEATSGQDMLDLLKR